MYEKILTAIGLTDGEAQIYELLLKTGPVPARTITKQTALKRATIYHILDLLVARGLVLKNTESTKTVFSPLSPTALEEVLAKREEEVRRGRQELTDAIDPLRSLFALTQDRPIVRFYEGAEGIRKVLEDSLSAKGTIYTYSDPQAANQTFKEINSQYAKKRIAMKIPKKIIALDSPEAREHYRLTANAFTQARLIPGPATAFAIGMQIYNNTVSYQTVTDEKMIGVIIEDQRIARLHKTSFEYIWNTLKPLPGAPSS